MKRSSLFQLAATFWALLVAVGLLIPGARVPAVQVSWIDKAAHLVLFMVLTWLVGRVPRWGGEGRMAGPAMVGLYALVLEVLQIPVPGRAFEFLDLAAALAGVALATIALRRRGHASAV